MKRDPPTAPKDIEFFLEEVVLNMRYTVEH